MERVPTPFQPPAFADVDDPLIDWICGSSWNSCVEMGEHVHAAVSMERPAIYLDALSIFPSLPCCEFAKDVLSRDADA
jgi:hypothetical protein